MEPKQNVIEIGPDGIKKSLNKVLRGWAKQYAEAEKKGPLKSNPYTQLRAAGHLTADFILEEAAPDRSEAVEAVQRPACCRLYDYERRYTRLPGQRGRESPQGRRCGP